MPDEQLLDGIQHGVVVCVYQLLNGFVFVRVGKQIVFLEIHDGGAIGVAYAVLHEYFAVESFVSVFVPEQSPALCEVGFRHYVGVVEYAERSPHIRYEIIRDVNGFPAVGGKGAENFSHRFVYGGVYVGNGGNLGFVDFFQQIVLQQLFDCVFAGRDYVNHGVAVYYVGEHCFVGVESGIVDLDGFSRLDLVIFVEIVLQFRFAVNVVLPIVDGYFFVIAVAAGGKQGERGGKHKNCQQQGKDFGGFFHFCTAPFLDCFFRFIISSVLSTTTKIIENMANQNGSMPLTRTSE